MSQLIDEEWGNLLDAIDQEKCIFFLGPGTTINFGESGRLDDFLGEKLKASLGPKFEGSIASYTPDSAGLWNSKHEDFLRSYYSLKARATKESCL